MKKLKNIKDGGFAFESLVYNASKAKVITAVNKAISHIFPEYDIHTHLNISLLLFTAISTGTRERT